MTGKSLKRNAFVRPLLLTGLCGAFILCDTALYAQADTSSEKKTERRSRAKGAKGAKGEEARKEYDAQQLLNKGLEYLEQKQEERGIKAISQISQQYPDTKADVKAEVALANYYIEKKQFDLAIRLSEDSEQEDPEIQLKCLQIGICHYSSASKSGFYFAPSGGQQVPRKRLRERGVLLYRPLPFQHVALDAGRGRA